MEMEPSGCWVEFAVLGKNCCLLFILLFYYPPYTAQPVRVTPMASEASFPLDPVSEDRTY